MTANVRPRVLFVAHGGAGGIARHMWELAALVAADADTWLLQPHGKTHLRLRSLSGPALEAWPPRAHWRQLAEWLREAGIDRVHFHHVDGLPQEALELPRALGCPYDATLHDYYPVCSTYHMVDAAGRFCGGGAACTRCEDRHRDQWGLDVRAWRAAFMPWLRDASRVIAPSADCGARIQAHAPQVSVSVWPHPEAPTAVQRVRRVLVLGAMSPEKGVDVLAACIEDARARALPLHFRLLGLTSRALPQWPAAPFSLSGEYPEGTLPQLLGLERGDAVAFLAQVPETYSYTLSAALGTGLPIVAIDLGAFRERLAGRANARLVPLDADATRINDILLEACATPADSDAVTGTPPEEYRARYLAPLAHVGAQDPPPLPDDWRTRPAEGPSAWTLTALFDDGVLCGRKTSAALLRERCVEADREIPQARAHIAEQEHALRALALKAAGEARELETCQAQLQRERLRAEAADAALARLESSRSWRLTAPVRALARALRGRG